MLEQLGKTYFFVQFKLPPPPTHTKKQVVGYKTYLLIKKLFPLRCLLDLNSQLNLIII